MKKNWLKTETNNLQAINSIIGKYKKGNKLYMGRESSDSEISDLFMDILWVRDQAHVFHWQTKLNSQHVILGDFYEDYLEEVDELAESIFGKTGKTCKVGNGIIQLKDYSEENLQEYLNKITEIFEVKFKRIFPETSANTDLYHIYGDIMEVINKLKYLIAQK